ncbi:MAG: zinc ribbon domain-containing protein [Verrucomicrobia bacterium]|nr:zinc ribbon domain-containing protein [Verrucomicrobiota bacterium]MDA1085470.1 zinc ribbon domain-containing protein [Verrucomicrobiota bacterium]
MLITVPCEQCGHDNDLGRIFCARCGVRLNADALTPDEVARQLKQKRAPKRRKNVLTLIGLLIVAAIGVAFWPTTIGAGPGDPRQGHAVAAKLETVAVELKSKGSLTRSMSEKDLNAYLAYVMLRKAEEAARKKERDQKPATGEEHDTRKKKIDAKPDAAVFADLAEGQFQLQVRKSYGPLIVGEYETPLWHLEYTLTGTADEGVVEITRASLGHVPFPFPFKAILVSAARRRVLAGFKHEAEFDNISTVVLEDNRVRFTLTR